MTDSAPWIVAEDSGDARKHAPATLRNRDAIATVLRGVLPRAGVVLEVASGSGEHCAFFADTFDHLIWQPSDPDSSGRMSIASWCAGMENVRAALDLDAAATDWPIRHADAILCVNMVHISPWEATVGLMAAAGHLLDLGAPLILYGPYHRAGHPIAAGNAAFDENLKSRDPRWGLRQVEAVAEVAAAHRLALSETIEMPANNLSLIFRRD